MQLWSGYVEDVHGRLPHLRVFEFILLHLWKVQLKKPITSWFSRCNSLSPVQTPPPQAPSEILLQTVTGRWQNRHGAGDQVLCPNTIMSVTFEAVGVVTFTSARLV